jgi:transposase
MAQERLGVRSIREVLRLKFVLNRSDTEVAASVKCARSTVAECVRRAKTSGLITFDDVSKLNDTELEARLYPKAHPSYVSGPDSRPLPNFSLLHAELKKRGNEKLTLSLLWEEYKSDHPSGYQFTQFCEYYKRFLKTLSISMRQEHRAGEKAFVDYCDGIAVTDPRTGEKKSTELFVGVLGASSYTFAEASFSQDLPSWLMSHVRMFEFFSGVPGAVVPDNLKSGVRSPDRYEPEINPSYQDMATHYGTCVLPARVRKPKDKAKVEAAVLVTQRWILARLRKKVFYSIHELNTAIAECLKLINDKKMRGINKSRSELYEELDRPALQSLPASRYEFAEWKKVRLHINYHIKLHEHFYSAPYTLIHKELWCRSTSDTVEIFHQGVRVSSHPRSYQKFKYTTDKAHMPEAHRSVAEWTPERIARWAGSIGEQTLKAVNHVMESRVHPEQAFNSALGMIRLASRHTPERLEKASARAIAIASVSYRTIKTILENRMESVEETKVSSEARAVAAPHSEQMTLDLEQNVRGKSYYH